MLKNRRVALAVPAGHYITQQINKCLHDVWTDYLTLATCSIITRTPHTLFPDSVSSLTIIRKVYRCQLRTTRQWRRHSADYYRKFASGRMIKVTGYVCGVWFAAQDNPQTSDWYCRFLGSLTLHWMLNRLIVPCWFSSGRHMSGFRLQEMQSLTLPYKLQTYRLALDTRYLL